MCTFIFTFWYIALHLYVDIKNPNRQKQLLCYSEVHCGLCELTVFSPTVADCLFVGDELAQVVGFSWIMRDSGGSLAQNRWQRDLGLTAVGQNDTGGG